ncbi:Dolichyl-phosphate-mannose-protein mannosyltransferase [Saccharicrinis carchari]|uniref:Dolichyl-phosphate-mannose-protein mannosyltransferase n=1 Tax=Saccharicrinis carchari TaxID=1168039 RepID=A0A521BVN6_SACCC|nr:glycosyltransferase family 39 protein [Saccharicrinis carchari]SMO51252.1 Dolichyl-phosphate-mannose-protein mannosyltransferase [Saccharicrinis carchari]
MRKKNKESLPEPFRLESWLIQRANSLFYLLLAVFVVFSFLYFNVKPSIAGDDSSYIIRGINFLESGIFPTYQGPVYPLLLSLIILLAGMNLLVLKLSSLVFMVGFIIVFYRTFKEKVSYTALFYTMAILSVSHLFLFFSSQTFSEALFLLLQAGLFYLLFKGMSLNEGGWLPSKKELAFILLVALCCVLLFLTRTIGFGALLATVLFFMVERKFKRALYVTVFFVALLSAFFTLRSQIWEVPVSSGEQSSQLMSKNPYDSSEGKEDFLGFVARFKDNSNLYLSKHLMRIIGFRSDSINTVKPPISFALYLLFIFGFLRFAQKNKYLYFTSVYLAIMLGITFFSLQKIWDQYRLIIPFVPLMLVVLVQILVDMSKVKHFVFIRKVLPVVLLLSVVLTFGKGVKSMDIPTLAKNIKGDMLAGYTPDWVSYLQMAEYCHDNLSEQQVVACRKPNLARIYGKGKKFHGIYRIPSNDPDELIQYLKERNISHIILGSLRKNPKQFTGQTINTIQRFMAIIFKKYPKTFKLVHKFGNQEPAYLYEIHYPDFETETNKQ